MINRPPRKKRRWIRWLAVGLVLSTMNLLIAMEVWLGLITGDHTIRISKETTWIVEPVDGDGRVDYLAYENQKRSANIDPLENAAIDYYRITGLKSTDEQKPSRFAKALEIPPVDDFDSVAPMMNVKLTEIVDEPPNVPWNAADLPQLSSWLEDNSSALDAAQVASLKPKFYMPLIALDENLAVYSTSLELIDNCQCLAEGLYLRSLLHIYNGSKAAAINDIKAIHRMAKHVGQAPGLPSLLIALRIEANALTSERFLIQSELLTSEEMVAMSEALQSAPRNTDVRKELDESDRLGMLDAVHSLSEGVETGLTGGDRVSKRASLFARAFDWNTILIRTNEWIDELGEVIAPSDPIERRMRFEHFERKLNAIDERGLSGFWSLGRIDRSRRKADLIATQLLPAAHLAADAEDRIFVLRELTVISYALHRYRLNRGSFPSELEMLVPEYLEIIPVDHFHDGQPLKYFTDGEGFTLYSVGQNLTDEGGYDEGTDEDLVVRSKMQETDLSTNYE